MKLITGEGIVGLVALHEAATGEYRQIIDLVTAACMKCMQKCMPMNSYCCCEAIYADRCICRCDGRYWQCGYTIGADNQVVMQDPVEVLEQYVPVTLREARAGSVFLEALDAEGAVWDAVLIRAGQANGEGHTYYPDAVLREAAPLFEGVRVFAKPDDVHLKGGGKDVHRLSGWISSPRFVEGKVADTGYIAGRVNLTQGSLRDTITDAWKRGKRDLVALSIDALGSAFREAKRRVAKAITKVNSVDLIVDAGAGGALVRLVEAAAIQSQETSNMKLRDQMLAVILAAAPAVHAKLLEGKTPDQVGEDELLAAYREALPAPAAKTVINNGLTQEQVAEQIRMVEARAHLRTAVATSKLPQAAQERLLADFGKREHFVEADVDAAIKAERVYVARFTESGKVKIDGEGNIQVEDRAVKISTMLDAFFDPAHKDHRSVQSFKECYVEITGDRRVTGRFTEMDVARMAESLGVFRESLDSTTFSATLGDAITRRLIADYRTPSQYDVWRPLVSVVPITDFRTQHRTRFGGYGNLPIVLEGDPYTALASPTDEEATYAVSKKGGTEDLTLEMIKNDDVGAIRRIPINLSRAAKRTLGQFVLDFLRTNPLVYDGVAFFDNAHGNLGAAALDATSLAAARLRMLKQTEAGSAARLGINPVNLVVPYDLQATATDLFKLITTVSDKTFIQNLALTVIPVWYWTDANDWAIGADPNDLPSIEIGFLDGNEEPELFVQDQPTVGSVFSNDKITYKERHIYGGQVVNYRGYDKSVVAP